MPDTRACSAADFVVLRSPALPVAALFPADGEALPDLHGWLAAQSDRPAVREALALASPDLLGRLDAWHRGLLSPSEAERVQRALMRYLTRMATRCTPFGLFAAVSLGRWARSSSMRVEAWEASRKSVRLDWACLEEVVASLRALPGVREAVPARPNTSLEHWGSWHRLLAMQPGTARGERSFHLEAVADSPHLAEALALAGEGLAPAELARRLAASQAVSLEDAQGFVEDLMASQVLVSDLTAPLTARDPLGWIGSTLDGVHPDAAAAEALRGLTRVCDAVASAPPGSHPEGAGTPAPFLKALGVPGPATNLLQVDLHRPARDFMLGPRVRRALEEGVDLLRRVGVPGRSEPLLAFARAFQERYGAQWVPLLKVLDEEGGLGFEGGVPLEAPLLEGVPFPSGLPVERVSARERFLLRRVGGWRGTEAWDLSDADLANLEAPEPPDLPEAFAALATLAASGDAALDRGDFAFFMEAYTGPTAARYLGRFAQGDPELEVGLRQLLEHEESRTPGALFAEVVHLPEPRAGNVLARPALRAWEIPFLATSSLPPDHQILPADLRVTVQGGRVRLASARLGREVIPRLSSAHNVARGPAVYRFLARLQDQDAPPCGWSWGLAAELPFLPRVQRGRHVLSRARWRVQGAELEGAQGAKEGFGRLRERRGLPRWVVLAEADQTLLVDLDQPLMVEGLHHLVAQRAAFTLTECFPLPGAMPLRGPEGAFAHELVVPFLSLAPPRPQAPLPAGLHGAPAPRFAPGGPWLSLKLYAGPATADRLLVELAPLIAATGREGLWDRWHFLRYRDPDPHLRLRFHGEPDLLLRALLPRLRDHLAPSLAEGALARLQVDTFEPEWNRYGGPEGFALVEAWFWADSQAVVERLDGGVPPGDRWRQGLETVAFLWNALGLTPMEALALARDTRAAFRREFADGGAGVAAFGRTFRQWRRRPEASGGVAPPPGPDVLARLRRELDFGTLPLDRSRLAGSLAHMHLNRLFRDHPREQEWGVMELLARRYESILARSGGPA